MPVPLMCAWWLARDIPFVWNTRFDAYLPDLTEENMYVECYNWIETLVGKIKSDLIAVKRWDRQRSVC